MKWFKILNFDKVHGVINAIHNNELISSFDLLVNDIKYCGSQLYVCETKNAMIAGALTGALVSASCNNNRDKIVMDARTGGAVATAMEFHNYLT
nr:uncharacterized protein LOC102589399 [Ipomoea trifida]